MSSSRGFRPRTCFDQQLRRLERCLAAWRVALAWRGDLNLDLDVRLGGGTERIVIPVTPSVSADGNYVVVLDAPIDPLFLGGR